MILACPSGEDFFSRVTPTAFCGVWEHRIHVGRIQNPICKSPLWRWRIGLARGRSWVVVEGHTVMMADQVNWLST